MTADMAWGVQHDGNRSSNNARFAFLVDFHCQQGKGPVDVWCATVGGTGCVCLPTALGASIHVSVTAPPPPHNFQSLQVRTVGWRYGPIAARHTKRHWLARCVLQPQQWGGCGSVQSLSPPFKR